MPRRTRRGHGPPKSKNARRKLLRKPRPTDKGTGNRKNRERRKAAKVQRREAEIESLYQRPA